MEYIQDDLMILLQVFSYTDWLGKYAGEVVKQRGVYQHAFNTYLPVATTREIHIIGCAHGGSNKEFDSIAIQSQVRATNLLKAIRPDIVGFEGSWDDEFTIRGYALGYLNLRGYNISDFHPEILDKYINELADEPSGNCVFKYAEWNKLAKIVTVEFSELMKLQLHLQDLMNQPRFSNDKIQMMYRAVARLRGLVMMARLGERLSKEPVESTAAIPVGYLHLSEIIELQQKFNAPWKFYNTTEYNLIDLPAQ